MRYFGYFFGKVQKVKSKRGAANDLKFAVAAPIL
jgi:hypothetical protein